MVDVLLPGSNYWILVRTNLLRSPISFGPNPITELTCESAQKHTNEKGSASSGHERYEDFCELDTTPKVYGMMRRWRSVVKRSKKLSSVGW